MRRPWKALSVFLMIVAALGDRPGAQSSSQPTVSIRRVTSLNDAVWPGDFNGDGITDLVATAPFNPDGSPRRIVIALGKGDGTFGAATQLSFIGEVLAVADVDKDGKRDLVVAGVPHPDGDVLLIFGNGNGTFTRTTRVKSYGYASFALVDDLDGDGFNDVIVGSPPFANGAVQAYRGAADGTYPELNTLATGALPMGGFVADLNSDGRKDLVVANHDGHSLSVFLNQGAFRFTPSHIPFDLQVNDVVATDVDRDGKVDLLVATSRDANDDFNYTAGDVTVLRGNGDGTFATPASYPTAKGAWQIVVGDFTGDGMLDVATANRSADYAEDCGTLLRGTDSVSILPGNANGTFGAASSFALGNQSTPADSRFRSSVRSLNTSDVNRDGRTDLIASWGAILITNPPDPNWPPTVSAGPDQRQSGFQTRLAAIAADADQDLLIYRWTASNGMFVENVADPCVTVPGNGIYTFTVTVDDGHGHQASDSVTYTVFGGWSNGDIGAVGAAGSVSFSDGVFTVAGSGADIWGAADEFQYVYQLRQGHFEMTTRVDSLESVNAWTKAGIMVRTQLNDSAPHVSIFVTPGKGIAFQRRLEQGGISVHTAGAAITAPVWLRVTSVSGTVCGLYRKNRTDPWTMVGCERIPSIWPAANIGFAVTSHDDGRLATAKFSNTYIGNLPAMEAAPIGSNLGTMGTDYTNYEITGRGADIWDTSDALMYLRMPMTGDGTITARVRSIQNVHAWSKAGVMFRETLDADSKQVDAIVSAAKGVAMQFRGATGGISDDVAIVPGAAPGWIRLSRAGDVFTGAWSKDGVTWTTLGSTTVSMAPTAYVGLAVTSHNTTTSAKGVFDDVIIQQ